MIDNPLARSRLTAMRDSRTNPWSFRAALHELTTMLVYEAARAFPVETYPIATPVAPTDGVRLANPPLLVPVLRAGLGMADAALALLPESSMGFVGLVLSRRAGFPDIRDARVSDRRRFLVPALVGLVYGVETVLRA